ncbi:hypothetical protein TRSC58_03024 [Trypanosoma rangeli SC58]|uniref:Uncharacterized protein n=1 Tax=Trypanosoma rangeli SC58 TaxID=429131 RepID=A0A061J2Y1_TRYRA|nr:hypothetical protein TRSC58_03024 [Trypanosoma rangeli SC58]
MHWIGIVGCCILIYGPLVIASVAALATHPQLLLLALSALLVALLGSFITALLFLATKRAPLAPLLVVVSVTVTGVLRVGLLFVLYRAESLARSYGQLLASSPMRFALVSAAVGCSFGAVSAMRGTGTLLDSTQRLKFYTKGTTTYDMNVCPRLPLLMHSALQSFMLLLCQVAWAVMTGQAVAALQLLRQPQRAWRQLLYFCGGNTSGGTAAVLDALEPCSDAPDTPMEADISPQPETAEQAPPSPSPLASPCVEGELPATSFCERVQRTEREAKEEEEEKEEERDAKRAEKYLHPASSLTVEPNHSAGFEPLLSQQEKQPVSLPEPTLLYKHPLLAVASLSAAFVLHLLFALASLLNLAARNAGTRSGAPPRGCVVSLPLQATITLVSLLWMAALIRLERARVTCEGV